MKKNFSSAKVMRRKNGTVKVNHKKGGSRIEAESKERWGED